MEHPEIIEKTDDLFKELKKYPENSKEYREIESEIIKANMRLATHIAKRYFPFMGPSLTKDDLIAEGYFALVKAIRTFKPEKEIAFPTYAGRCIQNEIIHCLKREPTTKKVFSLGVDIKASNHDGEKLKLEDVLESPVNIEDDIADKDEIQRQIAWVRKNLDHLKPLQKQVLIAKYLSGEASLVGYALAKKFNCTRQNISLVDISAISKLREMYYETHPEEIELTRKDNSTKLTTLCDSIQSSAHLKSVSEFKIEENGKEL